MRASIESWTFEGIGDLGAVTVAEAWRPVGREPATGDFFRIRDTGVRCIRAPCFSFRAWRLNRPYRVDVSGVDLGPARLTPEVLQQAEAVLTTPTGLVVAGGIVRTTDGGRVFRASQVFVKAGLPRA